LLVVGLVTLVVEFDMFIFVGFLLIILFWCIGL